MPMKRLTQALVLAAVAAGCVATSTPAADTWAGLSRTQAIRKAEDGLLAVTVAFKPETSPATLRKARAWMDSHPPKTRKVTCSGRRLWQVTWPKSDPTYVSRKTSLFSCH